MSAALSLPIQAPILTSGNFADEPAACAELDRRLGFFVSCFNSLTEVPGELTQLRPGLKRASKDEAPQLHMDRMLLLRSRIKDAGWKHGSIGIECKCSGKNIGPVVSQCLDYSRTLFKVDDGGTLVHLKWIFIWPLNEVYGEIASVMSQQRVGCVRPYGKNGLAFRAGSADSIILHDDLSVMVHPPACGNKVGSR